MHGTTETERKGLWVTRLSLCTVESHNIRKRTKVNKVVKCNIRCLANIMAIKVRWFNYFKTQERQ